MRNLEDLAGLYESLDPNQTNMFQKVRTKVKKLVVSEEHAKQFATHAKNIDSAVIALDVGARLSKYLGTELPYRLISNLFSNHLFVSTVTHWRFFNSRA